MNNFWRGLEALPGGRALLVVWQRIFGNDFAAIAPFLRATAEQAGAYPCLRAPACDCDHDLRPDLDGRLVAVCTCGDGDCEPVWLEPRAAMIYELDRRQFGGAVAGALGLRAPAAAGINPGRDPLEIGSYAPFHAPVYLCFPASEADLLRETEMLVGERPGPWLLLTPTRGCGSGAVSGALARAGCATLALETLLDAGDGGQLTAAAPLEPALSAWRQTRATGSANPAGLRTLRREVSALRRALETQPATREPVPEGVATRAFALVKALDAEELLRKPPSILTVFRLFCIEEWSTARIAERYHCSKLSILRRLKLIRTRTGTAPAQLRRLSPHFAKMEEAMRDPRARRIHRQRMIYDEEPGDD